MSAPVLVSKPLAHIVTFWRPGSHDTADGPEGANLAWTWAHEYADLKDDPVTERVRARVDSEGISFADAFAPVMLGNDGRVWDGHHRICIALERGIHALMVEVAGTGDPVLPTPDPTDERLPERGAAR